MDVIESRSFGPSWAAQAYGVELALLLLLLRLGAVYSVVTVVVVVVAGVVPFPPRAPSPTSATVLLSYLAEVYVLEVCQGIISRQPLYCTTPMIFHATGVACTTCFPVAGTRARGVPTVLAKGLREGWMSGEGGVGVKMARP